MSKLNSKSGTLLALVAQFETLDREAAVSSVRSPAGDRRSYTGSRAAGVGASVSGRSTVSSRAGSSEKSKGISKDSVSSPVKSRAQQYGKSGEIVPAIPESRRLTRQRSDQMSNLMDKFESSSEKEPSPLPKRDTSRGAFGSASASSSLASTSEKSAASGRAALDECPLSTSTSVVASQGRSTASFSTDISRDEDLTPPQSPRPDADAELSTKSSAKLKKEETLEDGAADGRSETGHRRRRRSSSCSDAESSVASKLGSSAADSGKDGSSSVTSAASRSGSRPGSAMAKVQSESGKAGRKDAGEESVTKRTALGRRQSGASKTSTSTSTSQKGSAKTASTTSSSKSSTASSGGAVRSTPSSRRGSAASTTASTSSRKGSATSTTGTSSVSRRSSGTTDRTSPATSAASSRRASGGAARTAGTSSGLSRKSSAAGESNSRGTSPASSRRDPVTKGSSQTISSTGRYSPSAGRRRSSTSSEHSTSDKPSSSSRATSSKTEVSTPTSTPLARRRSSALSSGATTSGKSETASTARRRASQIKASGVQKPTPTLVCADTDDSTSTAGTSPTSSKGSYTPGAAPSHDAQDSLDIFDEIQPHSRTSSFAQQHRIDVTPKGRRKATSNPIRALQQRSDVTSELAQSGPSAATIFSKSAQLSGMNISLAAAAVAGLAAKEDVTAVKLTSASDVGSTNWPKLLLLHIKGRRQLQVRVVEPKASSVNSGDSFILVNPGSRSVFQFIGKTANVVERAKSADMAKDIVFGKDCGCKGGEVELVEEGKEASRTTQPKFWSVLGAPKDTTPAAVAGEDVVVEKEWLSKTVVYEVTEDKLVLCHDLSGKSLKYAMFESKKVYILDFGNEVASWTGRRAPNPIRKKAASLVKEVFERGYIAKEGGRAKCKRPGWALLMNCKEGSETLLLRCKVHDWPEKGKVIQAGTVKPSNVVRKTTLVPCDVVAMRKPADPHAGLVVLQRNLGRGRGEAPSDDPCLPGLAVKLVSVNKWLVKESSCKELDESVYADFYEEEAYIVRWTYSLHAERSNLKSGVQSKQVGTDQVVYFFWQGSKCRIADKGTAALIVIELSGSDREPQVRVEQGAEPPAFLQMFDGGMTVHCGSSSAPPTPDVRVYAVHGVLEHEAHLQELPAPVQYSSLRSRHSFVLANTKTFQVFAWHGKQSPETVRPFALAAANKMAARCQDEADIKDVIELNEDDKCSALKSVLSDYGTTTLWDDSLVFHSGCTPRFFLFNASSTSFAFHRILPDWRHSDHCASFPASQAAFYEANQPAVGLVEAGHHLFVWCGWLREETEDDRTVGNQKSQFAATKKLAFQTAQSYLEDMKRKVSSKCQATVITAAYEPEHFRSLFLHWTDSEDARSAVAKMKPCSQLEPIDLEKEMTGMQGATYSLEVLRSKTLPDDLDPSALEQYLNDADFKEALSRTRDEFDTLPAWKKLQLRKAAGLF